MKTRHRGDGFTLLEVLVALAVIAIALGAILEQSARYAGTAARLREKTLALWVAHNRLTELEVQPAWPQVGAHSEDLTMGGTVWTSREQVSATADTSVHRLDVRVYHQGSAFPIASLSAFLSQNGRLVTKTP